METPPSTFLHSGVETVKREIPENEKRCRKKKYNFHSVNILRVKDIEISIAILVSTVKPVTTHGDDVAGLLFQVYDCVTATRFPSYIATLLPHL